VFQVSWIDHYTVEQNTTVDVGTCEYNSTMDIQFNISNGGTGSFEITDMSLENYAGEGFELTTNFIGDIGSGDSKGFTVRFSPVSGVEGYGANITINIREMGDAFNFLISGTEGGTSAVNAPSDLSATALSNSSIHLEWADNSDNETGFSIEKSLDGSSGWTEIDTVGAGVTTHNDDFLDAETTYWYRVYATSNEGNSNYSNIASATTPAAPDTTNPTLTVENVLDGGVLETGFIVGTASDNIAVSSVGVNLDSAGWQTAAGTTTWSYQIPTGANIWKNGTSHTISVRAKDGSDNYSTVFSATVEKSANKDTNGDGYVDLVIGAPGYSSNTGKIYLYNGSASGLSTTISLTRQGSSGDGLGYSVAVSDFNGDGYADVAVGSYIYSSSTGRVGVFYGGSSGIDVSVTAVATGPTSDSYFGSTMAAGDANNDGHADLAVGARGYSSDTGQVTVCHGSSSGISTTASRTLTGTSNSRFGKALAFGDANNDSYADLAAGADGYNTLTGRAYVYHGGISGISTTASRTLTGEATGDFYGHSIFSGDSNLDGIEDLLVGAYCYDQTYTNRGKMYHYAGSASGIPTTTSRTWLGTGTTTNEYFSFWADF